MSKVKKQTLAELVQLCKERGMKGCDTLKRNKLLELLAQSSSTAIQEYEYVYQPMITYIGNKRKLIPWIMEVVEEIYKKQGNKGLRIMDGFAGSGVVSRVLRPFTSELHCNDMEYYSYILLRSYLEIPNEMERIRLEEYIEKMKKISENPMEIGFVTRLYSPERTESPKENERCFYTRENGMIIDSLLKYIFNEVEVELRHFLLGPLLIKASIHVNTAGVFRGFYKKDGIGHFGGAGENALERILVPIKVELPIWSKFQCKVKYYQSDIYEVMNGIEDGYFDLIYLDPPYNEHPYGSNYFMLNLIASNKEPNEYSKVSGIPKDWNKSKFNGRGSAYEEMLRLLKICVRKSKNILISYNNEGLIKEEEWIKIWSELKCRVYKYEKEYDTYHGSRNLAKRNMKVVERMFLLEI